MSADRIVMVPASEIEALRGAWFRNGGYGAINALVDRIDSEPSMSDDERERMAWDLLPADVRDGLMKYAADVWHSDRLRTFSDYARRMTAPPPWEPSDYLVSTYMAAVDTCDREIAVVELRALHTAGLLAEVVA